MQVLSSSTIISPALPTYTGFPSSSDGPEEEKKQVIPVPKNISQPNLAPSQRNLPPQDSKKVSQAEQKIEKYQDKDVTS